MSQNEHASDHGGLDMSDDRARAVEEAGRRAGAALRSPAPADGAAAIQSRAHRRRFARVAAATAGVGVLLVAGVMAIGTHDGSLEPQPADTVTNTLPNTSSTTPTPTSAPATIDTTTTDEQITTVPSAPTTAAPVHDDVLTWSVDPDGDARTPLRVTYQVPTDSTGTPLLDVRGWFGALRFLPGDADGITALSITTVTNLVGDGCRDHTPLDPPVGPTVDDLATALSQLAPFEVTAPPTDVTLFGYHGKHLELTVPALTVTGAGDASPSKNIAKFTGCVEGELYSWISPLNDAWGSPTLLGHSPDSHGAFNAYQAPGQTEEFWILDVDGTRIVFVSFDTPGAPAEDIAARDAIFESIRIEP
jgi:hypothetical protein